ncbi:phage tail protein [Xenorhabdus sp. SF857]|uniref:phage tail protein n=1 Tax=Xenorhabdus bakwenae TaxID=3026967 RepID=UPI00255809D8|nr:phage tail protein [Xenorhabdus sp. SF857]WFQ79522.1 phage tail protein [Xenorhabdus sp. SF857]
MQDKKPEIQILEDDGLVVVPTPEYVKDLIEEHAQSRNHPDATLQDKGFVILSNDVSGSETMAATPKAVKAAYDLAHTANQYADNANDNANTRLAKDQNGADISDKAEFVKSLGLSELVYRTIGNGPGQIPDMSFFKRYGDTKNGWVQYPNGLIYQWGVTSTATNDEIYITFPIQFSSGVSMVSEHDHGGGTTRAIWQINDISLTGFLAVNLGVLQRSSSTFNPPFLSGCQWHAWGF